MIDRMDKTRKDFIYASKYLGVYHRDTNTLCERQVYIKTKNYPVHYSFRRGQWHTINVLKAFRYLFRINQTSSDLIFIHHYD